MKNPVPKTAVKEMVKLYKKGYSRFEIAAATGYAPETVSKYMKKHQYSFSEGREPVREITGQPILVEDMRHRNYGVAVGDKVIAKLKSVKDENQKSVIRGYKGVVEGIYDFFITVMTDKGYRITVSKADLAIKRNSITKV